MNGGDLVEDLLRQVRIVVAHVVHDPGFRLLADEVEDFGGVTDAAHGGLFDAGGGAGHEPGQGIVELAQGYGLDAVQGGDAQNALARGHRLADPLGGVVQHHHARAGRRDLHAGQLAAEVVDVRALLLDLAELQGEQAF
mgnify:CR=1 FL=1